MRHTPNVYGHLEQSIGQMHHQVWLGTVNRVPVGGKLASSFLKDGALIPAGCPVNFASGTITPLAAFYVVSFTPDATGDDTIVIKPCVYGGYEILPKASDLIQKLGSTFAATGKAAVVKAVTALTGDDAGKYSVTVVHSATIDTPSAGDYIVFSSATAAGSSKSMANQPNAYLYNDIYVNGIDVTDSDASATGAVVQFHADGLLIDRTDFYAFEDALRVAIPHVLLVND